RWTFDINARHHWSMKMDRAISRRTALQLGLAGTAALAVQPQLASGADSEPSHVVDPTPHHELSPYLYMQFLEPLGTTDGSIEAAWDPLHDRWRPAVVDAPRAPAPPLLRWGGIFSDYYRWREGVGPRAQRPPMHNLLWGGMESNQIGTAEFISFCRDVGAAPLLAVNFESDGRKRYMEAKGSVRTADAREAAEWVAYCNHANHPDRASHG